MAQLTNTHINKKSFSAYIIGFMLSTLLTIVAFALVSQQWLPKTYVYGTLAALAVLQLCVQSICFLNLNHRKEEQWNVLSYLLTLFIIAILVSGSLWIMYNLNYNMMN